MENKSVFTFIKKYGLIVLLLALVLTGCSDIDKPIDENTTGFFNHYFVYNFSVLIKTLAEFMGGSYGMSIIIITLAIRLVLMPFMLKQTKSSLEMQDKMGVMKPELDAIQKKYKGKKDRESQTKMQQEMMQLYQKHNFNPLASMAGCLPLIIQMPIILAFYYAIRRTPEIATHHFLWFDLGHVDIALTIIAVIIYFVQFKVSQLGLAEQQRKQMAMIGWLSPIMIGVISFNSPAALPLYWAVGGLFIVLQTLISKKIYFAHKKELEAKKEK